MDGIRLFALSVVVFHRAAHPEVEGQRTLIFNKLAVERDRCGRICGIDRDRAERGPILQFQRRGAVIVRAVQTVQLEYFAKVRQVDGYALSRNVV